MRPHLTRPSHPKERLERLRRELGEQEAIFASCRNHADFWDYGHDTQRQINNIRGEIARLERQLR